MAQYKQVLVIAKYLGMRAGKMVAQGAHASMMCFVRPEPGGGNLDVDATEWVKQGMSKICVRVDSPEDFAAIEKRARDANLHVHVVIDAGHTEFGGVPTQTCIAIGPNLASDIDKITGELTLL